MKIPKIFSRKPKDKTDWKARAEELELRCKGLETSISAFARLDGANLRLIHELRQMDQWVYQLVQHASNWKLMQPIVARMNELVENRMKIESDRVRNLMVGEIRSAYNEPENWRIFNQDKPVSEVPIIDSYTEIPTGEIRRVEKK